MSNKLITKILGVLFATLMTLTSCDNTKEQLPDPKPTFQFGAIDAKQESVTIDFTFDEADQAYILLEEGEQTHDSDYIITNGRKYEANGSATFNNLTSATTYTISGVAVNGEFESSVVAFKCSTLDPDPAPAVTITKGTATTTTLSFTVAMTESLKGFYFCTETGGTSANPTAATIIESGDTFNEDGEITVSDLSLGTEYQISAVSVNGDFTSEVVAITMTTENQSLPDEPVFDRQINGGYYGKGDSYSYLYKFVLAESSATEDENGQYVTNNAGRTMHFSLNQMAPSDLDRIKLPARDYTIKESNSISIANIDDTYCMVKDYDGTITRIDFEDGGVISVTNPYLGDNYTISVAAITTDGEIFNATYEGTLTFEDLSGTVTPDGLDPMTESASDLTFTHALCKRYESDYADEYVLHLYTVEPTINGTSDYINSEGYMVSLDLLSEISDETKIDSGNYTPSNYGFSETFFRGGEETFQDMILPTGTHCEQRTGDYTSLYGLADDGVIVVVRDGDNYDIEVELETKDGITVTGNYSGEITFTDMK